jgi:predicted dehydrogenase
VGCGQLGSRHLQALAALPQIGEIEVVDPSPGAQALGQERLHEVADRVPGQKVQWLSGLQQATAEGDLCVISTLAPGRSELVQQVATELGYRAFLLEKIVAQSVAEYQQLMDFAADKGLSVWVNCQTRAFPIYQKIKAALDPGEPLLYHVMGGNHGLATNGVHAADLFLFLDGGGMISENSARIDPVLHSSKRGQEMYELSGTVTGISDKGSDMVLSFAADHMCPHLTIVTTPRARYVVDHMKRWAWGSGSDNNWDWQTELVDENLFVSYMTRVLAADILDSGTCALPTLQECFPSHRFILQALQPHFNALLSADSDRCPVT